MSFFKNLFNWGKKNEEEEFKSEGTAEEPIDAVITEEKEGTVESEEQPEKKEVLEESKGEEQVDTALDETPMEEKEEVLDEKKD